MNVPSDLRSSVMVVEDDYDIREAISEVLEDSGYRALCAANGRDAIELLHSGVLPGLVLLDLMMPVMDGRELFLSMLRDEKLREIPVVVLSAQPSRDQTIDGLAPKAWLKKPVHLDTLLSTVRRFCLSPSHHAVAVTPA
jgi:DNA-binding response OmpR family regulator